MANKNHKILTTRAAAAEVIAKVLRGQSLSALLPEYSEKVEEKDRPLLKELCFGTLRWYPQISILLKSLIQKPLREKELEIQGLLACGLYQLMHMRIAEHAIINETVSAVTKLNRPWAKGLVNAVLRSFQRQQQELLDGQSDNEVFQTAHPKWLLKKINDSWPEEIAAQIIAANNERAPMTLRVNALRTSRQGYLDCLAAAGISASAAEHSAQGIVLEAPCDVNDLPNFKDGHVSVQDEAAQLAAGLLMLDKGQRVLDACCAPGGKTCHILESAPDLESLLAIDLEQRRLIRVEENLARLQLKADLKAANANDLERWWDGNSYDRILIDAPCSATGVIRRHPDIKILRKPADIDKLAAIQTKILTSLWQTLKPGGILVYATCSVLPDENEQIIKNFIASQSDAEILKIDATWGIATDNGRQLFPLVNGNDGFYYSRLRKL
ncbi:16S rRNA (cytosine(967)-C(5))-methyltransferase RsmB [Porticoccaceae bacterium]|jgi:16S rRNA (cytosine967-C5)-methyltransferase|nr:16S rRNA (cytosine(967)-C(5))-methyltransferase RsmB [Porticoccaceae bacterium]MDB4077622.1 16S rRNA (cytosine(967)-C(5))-methyltransferase RsmB [Porticoccaceae bacterium]MDC0004295.1 16S rRNA (cytosine(967)-C(5))-methyltransferase RsmB [Porticoccaceae bacterium]